MARATDFVLLQHITLAIGLSFCRRKHAADDDDRADDAGMMILMMTMTALTKTSHVFSSTVGQSFTNSQRIADNNVQGGHLIGATAGSGGK